MSRRLVVRRRCNGRRLRERGLSRFRDRITSPKSRQPATTSPRRRRIGRTFLTFHKFSLYAAPPAGWTLTDHNSDARAEHVVWKSPSGDTAFGAVFFHLPWPIGHEFTLRFGILPEARKREGSAELLEKFWDSDIEGLRFTIRTPRYTVETKLFVRGMRGWAAYSGTMTTRPVNEIEQAQARQARDDADFGEEIPAADERR